MKYLIILMFILMGCSQDCECPKEKECDGKPVVTPTKTPTGKPTETVSKTLKPGPFQIFHIKSKDDLYYKIRDKTEYLVLEWGQVKAKSWLDAFKARGGHAIGPVLFKRGVLFENHQHFVQARSFQC